MIKTFLEFIDQNEAWLIADRMEDPTLRKKGSQLWEKEHRLNEVKEKRRKLKDV